MSNDKDAYYDGVAADSDGDFAAAINHYLASWEIHEHAATAFRIGKCLIKIGRLDEASMWLDRAVLINPRNSQYSLEYAKVLIHCSKPDQSRQVLESLLARAPTYKPAIVLLQSLSV